MIYRVRRALSAAIIAASLPAFFAVTGAFAQAPAAEGETTGILKLDPEATSAGGTGQSPNPPFMDAPEQFRGRELPTGGVTTGTVAPRIMQDLDSSQTVVLATWDGGTFTNHDLSSTLQMRRPPSAGNNPVDRILRLPPDRLRPIVRDLIYEMALYRKARAEGLNENSPVIAEKLKRHRDTVLNRLVFQRSALPLLVDAEEKTARQHYEENKHELYTVPQKLTVRNLHISSYIPYTVQEGDTLTGIAESVAGDLGAISSILRDEPLYYPRVPLTGVRGPVPIVEVKPGEKLLVPMKQDDLTSAESVARQIQESLSGGEAFDEVRARFPQALVAHEGKPFEPELEGAVPGYRNAVLDPNATTVSEVLRTPWGFSIIQIADRQPTRTLSFEEVEETIFGAIAGEDTQRKTMAQVRNDLFDHMSRKYNLKLNETALRRENYTGDNPLTGSTVLANASDFTYTLDQFLMDLRPTERTWSSMSYEERINMIKGAPSVVQYLFQKEAEAEGLDKLPTFVDEMKSKEIMEVVAEYMRREQEATGGATEARLREYYQQHLDRYTSAPRVTLREITKRVSLSGTPEKKEAALEKARRTLSQIRSRIQSQADFEQAARRESESLATRSRGGALGTVESGFRGEAFANQIAQLQPGQVSEPFLYGSEMVIIRLDERQPSTVIPFEDALPQVRMDYLREVPLKEYEQRRDQVLAEVNYKPAF